MIPCQSRTAPRTNLTEPRPQEFGTSYKHFERPFILVHQYYLGAPIASATVALMIREIARYLDAKNNLSLRPRANIAQLVLELRDMADEARCVLPGPRGTPQRHLPNYQRPGFVNRPRMIGFHHGLNCRCGDC